MKPWLNETGLIEFNLAVASILGIALSIVLSVKGPLFFQDFGFVIYLGVCLGLLILMLNGTLAHIGNPIDRLAESYDRVMRRAEDYYAERERYHQSIGLEPEQLSLRQESSNLGLVLVWFTFVPLPWILSTDENHVLIEANLGDPAREAIIAAIFLGSMLVTGVIFRSVFPGNVPKERSTPLSLFSILTRGMALVVSTVFYMKVPLDSTYDSWYVAEVAIGTLLVVMIAEIAYMWKLKHEFPYNI